MVYIEKRKALLCIYAVCIPAIFLAEALEQGHYDVEATSSEGTLLCRRCGHEIVHSTALHRRINSKTAMEQRNATVIGMPHVLIQKFENPQGQQFEIIVAENADVYHHGNAYLEDTWFDGYAWRVALCPSCGVHLGWSFQSLEDSSCHSDDHHNSCHRDNSQSTKDSFIGLILKNLLSEDFANTLTIVPKPKSFQTA